MLSRIIDLIHRDGPLTVARFMEIALYDPLQGYYARAPRRSGRTGDFFTSIDVGALFGTLLARFVARAWEALGRPARFDVVEAGASDGRLAADLLEGLAADAPGCYEAARVTLVERSERAREAQAETLGTHTARLVASVASLPPSSTGVLYSNELLDAFPVHRVQMTRDGLVEIYVVEDRGRLTLAAGPLSTPAVAQYVEDNGIVLAEGAVADVSLAAVEWCRAAAASLEHGYLLVIDYGYRARERASSSHGAATLRSFSRHLVDAPGRLARDDAPPWLASPGERDVTAHVDFAAIEDACRSRGLVTLAFQDQTRFLLRLGLAEVIAAATTTSLADTRRRLAAQALVAPEGIGGSHHALVLATPGLPTPV